MLEVKFFFSSSILHLQHLSFPGMQFSVLYFNFLLKCPRFCVWCAQFRGANCCQPVPLETVVKPPMTHPLVALMVMPKPTEVHCPSGTLLEVALLAQSMEQCNGSRRMKTQRDEKAVASATTISSSSQDWPKQLMSTTNLSILAQQMGKLCQTTIQHQWFCADDVIKSANTSTR